MNGVIQTMLSHRSIRSYKETPVDENELEQIIEAVQAAPSWINGQQVTVIRIKDGEKKKRLAELCGGQKHIEEAPVFLVFCSDFYRAYLAGKLENRPVHVSDNIDTLLVGATDVGIALGTAVTAAESIGLGTVAIGGIRKNLSAVIKELDLPPYVIPISGLCIGYPAEEPKMKPRLPKEAVYHTDTYKKDLEQQLSAYNEIYSDYLGGKESGKPNWTEAVAGFYGRIYYEGVEEALKSQKLPYIKR